MEAMVETMTRYATPLCPLDRDHGRLLDWSGRRWGWYCPHRGHEGNADTAQSRPFFTTQEAEEGRVIGSETPKTR